jgi:hypothetical protein
MGTISYGDGEEGDIDSPRMEFSEAQLSP